MLKQLLDIHTQLQDENAGEEADSSDSFVVVRLFTVPRNRRAALACFIIMFMQQFCGASIIDSFSSNIFYNAGLNDTQNIVGIAAYWMLVFLFSMPAAYTIDTYGRRFLLLATFPGTFVSMLVLGIV